MNTLFWLLGLNNMATADPCGMVPPISVASNEQMIARRGIQRTYVMHKNGIETMALHPAFTGKVKDFGMLIPFPSPPELYKINDETFAQLERALAPPTIIVYQYDNEQVGIPDGMSFGGLGSGLGGLGAIGAKGRQSLQDSLHVREEALGMYQVAVIEAGSAKALKRWMQEHQYKFPDGMEDVAQDYVEANWAFVAIKTKIGAKSSIEPEAGMREVDTSYPEGSSFDGYVQGMGFRFPSDEAVVPMRLSVFNGRNPHNIVYLFSDKQMQIDKVNQSDDYYYLSGEKLHKNLTEPMNVTFHVGSMDKLNQDQKQQLQEFRDPDTITKGFRQFLQSDLMALQTSSLLLDSEKKEKELLAISESFSLRGEEINKLHQDELEKRREKHTRNALVDLKKMHLSIFSGVLPNTLIQEENLRFVPVSSPKPDKIHIESTFRISNLTTTSYQAKPLSTINIPSPNQNLTVNRPSSRTSFKVSIQKIDFTKGKDQSNTVQQVLRRYMNQFRYCYQRIVFRDPSLKGVVSVLTTIGENGKVIALVGQDTVKNSAVSSCVAGRFKRIRFPEHMNDSQFQVWFRFSR